MILVVFNPISGSIISRGVEHQLVNQVLPNARQTIEQYFQELNIEYTLIDTSPDGDDHIAAAIHELQPERIIACGGDGTVREVADILLRTESEIPLAIIPLGTMNVIALSLNIPLSTYQAIRYAVRHSSVPCDIGVVNDTRYFIVAFGIGYDAAFIKGSTRPIKKLLGPLSYPVVAFSKAFNHDRIHGTVTTDHGTQSIDASWLGCINIKTLIQYNPVIRILPTRIGKLVAKFNTHLTPHRGMLDIIIANKISFRNMLRLSWTLLTGKQPTSGPMQLFTTSSVQFSSETEVECEVDGEFFTAKEISLRIIPNALHIVCSSRLFG